MVVDLQLRGIKIRHPQPGQANEVPRGRVTQFSAGTKKRLGWAYANGDWQSMLTLTYGQAWPEDGRESKEHLNAVLVDLRRRIKAAYLWILEWQGRGAPHYHVWFDRELTETEWISIVETWLRVTASYDDRQVRRRVALHPTSYTTWQVVAGCNYAVKYAEKQQQKGLPIGVESYGRWWATSRGAVKTYARIEHDDGHVDENGEVDRRATQTTRNIKRALEHWFPKLKKHKRDSRKGCQIVLRESRRDAVLRILRKSFDIEEPNFPKTASRPQRKPIWIQVRKTGTELA